jgi:hypothetical protein
MANPTTVIIQPAILEATTTPATIVLNPNLVYEITHLSVDSGGNAHTDSVMIGLDGTTAAIAAGARLLLLQSGKTVKVFGCTAMSIDAVANDPILNISPLPR